MPTRACDIVECERYLRTGGTATNNDVKRIPHIHLFDSSACFTMPFGGLELSP
jgi:hypothetical protein